MTLASALTAHDEPLAPNQLASLLRAPAARRSYLCQYVLVLVDGEQVTGGLPLRHFAESPGQAVRWLRRAVRRLAPTLDEHAERLAAEWLDDAAGYHAAVLGLLHGEAILLALPSDGLRLQIEARPVITLTTLAASTTS
ncbi:hypothetical protein [Kitasatospora sp. NPDC050463]|uniref:hypothetical protein n=1 Tax=Kitasatospora sp. NPDC050463 TaxID=3155786 RepID=UPI0033FDD049